ncbi:MAG: NUDIX domain-containing protein [Patescibacteria group bacterium]
MVKKLPIIIQTIIFKIHNNEPQFLLLKRNEGRGGFWNAVNGTMEMNENVGQCQRREILEETGISVFLNNSDELYRFVFNYKDIPTTVIAFASQIDENQVVLINEEHTEYGWFDFNEAVKILKFEDDKKSLEASNNYVKQLMH